LGSLERLLDGSCTLEELIEFGEVSGSRGPIHTDRDLATRLFGGPVVQAALLMEFGLAGAIALGQWHAPLERTSIDARFFKLVLADEPFSVDMDSEGPDNQIGIEVNNLRGLALSMRVFERGSADA
jgi:hypothetical protein